MASSSSGRSRSSQLPGNTAVYSGAAALLALLVVLRRQLVDTTSSSKNHNKGNSSSSSKKWSKSVSHTPLTTPQVEAAQRELYRVLPDGSRELLVPTGNSGRIAKVIIRPVKESTYAQHRKDFISDSKHLTQLSKSESGGSGSHASSSSAVSAGTGISGATRAPASSANAAGQSANQVAKKVAVNKEFLRQLRAILKIIIPRWVTFLAQAQRQPGQPHPVTFGVRGDTDCVSTTLFFVCIFPPFRHSQIDKQRSLPRNVTYLFPAPPDLSESTSRQARRHDSP